MKKAFLILMGVSALAGYAKTAFDTGGENTILDPRGGSKKKLDMCVTGGPGSATGTLNDGSAGAGGKKLDN